MFSIKFRDLRGVGNAYLSLARSINNTIFDVFDVFEDFNLSPTLKPVLGQNSTALIRPMFIMPFSFLRPLARSATRGYGIPRLSKPSFSTQRAPSGPIYWSKAFFTGATLLIGLPIGWYAKSVTQVPESQSKKKLGDLYEGSLNWKGKFVPPCTMNDVEGWLVKEQSIHQGMAGSGVREWHSSRHPSNTPGEDELVNARVHLPRSFGEGSQAWMFWGVFDGHV
jgi:pyruvate dehydrogenase phosphatase